MCIACVAELFVERLSLILKGVVAEMAGNKNCFLEAVCGIIGEEKTAGRAARTNFMFITLTSEGNPRTLETRAVRLSNNAPQRVMEAEIVLQRLKSSIHNGTGYYLVILCILFMPIIATMPPIVGVERRWTAFLWLLAQWSVVACSACYRH